MTRKVARAPRGALVLLVACFFLSSAFRLVDLAPAAAQQVAAPTSQADAVGGAADTDALLAAIREREAVLNAREKEIEERLAFLAIVEEQYEQQRAELVAAEERLSRTLALAETAAEEDLTRLTAIYENVKPKQAAVIFDSMDTKFAAGVLGRMTPQAAGDILTLMDADKAYAISVILAARNMNAGREDAPRFNDY